MQKITKPFKKLWSSDRGLSLLVILLVFTVFIVPHLAQPGAPILTLLFDIGFSLVLVTGLTAIARKRQVIVGGILLLLIALAGRWMERGFPGANLVEFNLLMSVFATLLLTGLVTVQVFREGPITIHRVLGAVAVYLLLGLAWAFTYQLIAVHTPGSFTIEASAASRNISQSEFLYFSFVTLTTTGYGDITALAPAARSMVMLEALTGQLFPAILIARLVSMEIGSRVR